MCNTKEYLFKRLDELSTLYECINYELNIFSIPAEEREKVLESNRRKIDLKTLNFEGKTNYIKIYLIIKLIKDLYDSSGSDSRFKSAEFENMRPTKTKKADYKKLLLKYNISFKQWNTNNSTNVIAWDYHNDCPKVFIFGVYTFSVYKNIFSTFNFFLDIIYNDYVKLIKVEDY